MLSAATEREYSEALSVPYSDKRQMPVGRTGWSVQVSWKGREIARKDTVGKGKRERVMFMVDKAFMAERALAALRGESDGTQ